MVQWALRQNQAAMNRYNASLAGTDLLSFMLSTRPFWSWLLYLLCVHAERGSSVHVEWCAFMLSSVYCMISLFSITDASVLIDQLCTMCLRSLLIKSSVLPSSSLCSWQRRLLASSARLQPIKYVRHHPLITISTLAGNRSEQAVTVDVKLTQIHQDELPFFYQPSSAEACQWTCQPLTRIPSATATAGLASMSLACFAYAADIVCGVTQGQMSRSVSDSQGHLVHQLDLWCSSIY